MKHTINVVEKLCEVIKTYNALADNGILVFTSKRSLLISILDNIANPLGIEIISPAMLDFDINKTKSVKIKVATKSDIYSSLDTGNGNIAQVNIVGRNLALTFKYIFVAVMGVIYHVNIEDLEQNIKILFKEDPKLIGSVEKFNIAMDVMLNSYETLNMKRSEEFPTERINKNLDKSDKISDRPFIKKEVVDFIGGMENMVSCIKPIFTMAKYGINIDLDILNRMAEDGKPRTIELTVPETSEFKYKGEEMASESSKTFVFDSLNEYFSKSFSPSLPKSKEFDIHVTVVTGLHWDKAKYDKADFTYSELEKLMVKRMESLVE